MTFFLYYFDESGYSLIEMNQVSYEKLERKLRMVVHFVGIIATPEK